MEPIKVFGVIVGFLILVYLLSWVFNRSKTLSNMTDATIPITIPATSLPNSGNMNYAYSIWIYVNDWSYLYGKEKVIFVRGAIGSLFMPSLTLEPTENTLRITVSTDDEPLDCYVPNIPLQQWVCLIVTLNNKSLDSYVNGKLVKTCVLSALPKISPDASIYLTPAGGFSGFTSRFQYWSSYMSPQQAWNIYKRDPAETSLVILSINTKSSLILSKVRKYRPLLPFKEKHQNLFPRLQHVSFTYTIH